VVENLVITLREGLEAALLLGILIAYLTRTGNQSKIGSVWLGTLLAVLGSVAAGALIFITVGQFDGQIEQLFEGGAMLIAVVVLSYMVVWMRQQAINIRSDLQGRVDAALRSRSTQALGLLAFVLVVREGLETVLFLFATTRATSPVEASIGGITGLAIAIALGYLVYRGGSKINLRTFFNVTGVLLIFVAAGLLTHALYELTEAGFVPSLVDHVWNTNAILSDEVGFGSFLKALFGYISDPSLFEVLAYVLYLVAALWHFFGQGSSASRRTSTAHAIDRAGSQQKA
jgi:high-affinity iron transporter